MHHDLFEHDLPAALQRFISVAGEADQPLRAGSGCPQCMDGLLDYDGVLNLVCSSCGFNTGGGGGCT